MKWTWPTVWADERGGWWRLALTLALWVGGLVLGMLLYTAVMIGLRDALKNEPVYVKEIVRLLAGAPAQHGLMLAGCLVGIRFLHHKAVACVFTDGRPFRFGLAVQSAALWALLWFAGTVSFPDGWERLVQRAGEIPLAWWPLLSGVTLCAIALQATDEEVVFRGYLLTHVAAWVKRPWIAVGIMTLFFAAMHTHTSPAATTAVALFGIAFGAAGIRAGTLAPMIGVHAVNNALQSLWFPNDTNAGTAWLETLVLVVQLSIWFGWLLWATRRRMADTVIEP